MPSFKVAHVQQQGIDLIIIEVDSSFRGRPPEEQQAIRDELQTKANGAGLSGMVVPIWDQDGAVGFLAPLHLAAFFSSLTPEWFLANVNRELVVKG